MANTASGAGLCEARLPRGRRPLRSPVRLFAAFEAALHSYDRAKHNDSARETKAAVMNLA